MNIDAPNLPSRTRPSVPALSSPRVATSLVFLLVGTATGLWAAHIPGIAARLGLGEARLGLALFAVAAGALAAMPAAGRLAGQVGAGRLCLWLGLGCMASMPLPVLAPSFASLLLAGAVFGAFLAGTDIAMNARGAEVEAALGSSIFSSLHGFYSLGGLLGAGLGGAMVALGQDGGGGIALAAVLGVLPLLAMRRALVGAGPSPGSRAGGRFRLPSRAEWGLGMLAFLAFLIEGAVTDWSALWLRDAGGARPGLEVLGFALFSVAMAGCRFAGDRMVERLGRASVLQGGGALVALGMALALAWPEGGALGFGLVGLGAANVVPVLFGAAAQIRGGADPAGSLAAVATMAYGGFLLGPALLGGVAGAVGLGPALALLVPMALGIALGGALLPGRSAAAGTQRT